MRTATSVNPSYRRTRRGVGAVSDDLATAEGYLRNATGFFGTADDEATKGQIDQANADYIAAADNAKAAADWALAVTSAVDVNSADSQAAFAAASTASTADTSAQGAPSPPGPRSFADIAVKAAQAGLAAARRAAASVGGGGGTPSGGGGGTPGGGGGGAPGGTTSTGTNYVPWIVGGVAALATVVGGAMLLKHKSVRGARRHLRAAAKRAAHGLHY